jgi:DNA-binding IclR family transcriptional regulator
MANRASVVPRDPYLCKAVVRSFQILGVFRSGEALRFSEVLRRCDLPRTMVFRMLYTLEHCGFIEKVGKHWYQRSLSPTLTRARPEALSSRIRMTQP